ncbi:hypothetical protein DICPUDRAFT_30768 [Dictyostelium purpureum]|uniref:Major facilitator superfamily (MFS) profile domain-containing protein n=1 Tax=Dictyostelium purpureum TaxID=5786 RepID=F0ZFY7_DICPU|nr:uncharacterized protein DICPUDRAFT_30768 [Dictyostelium purpureum]EGC37122.1 hypothetical protein DICPUDRAFT_30768 [Dictyostelium purpureum]|eukprot:XP_003286325.1 hypothetical protein DICPUDRAFT_30768 [Dictyostelium purpureum]
MTNSTVDGESDILDSIHRVEQVRNRNHSFELPLVKKKVSFTTPQRPSWLPHKPLWLQRVGSSSALIIILAASGGLIFGYNTGIIGPALGHIKDERRLNTVQQGLIVSGTLLGALISSFFGGFLADWIGRKPVIFITAIVTIGGAISSAATNPLGLIAPLRIILGFGVGISSAVCPLMVAEVVPVEKRGAYGSIFQLFITIGLLWANVMGVLLMRSANNWRWMFAIGSVPGFFVLIIWCVINESPVWIENKRLERERRIQGELINEEPSKKKSWRVLMEPKNRKPMFLGVVLCVFQQLTGINAFMYFSNIIFEYAGFTQEYGAITCSCILQVWNVSTTVVAALVVDKIGRRPLLFVGSIVMTAMDLLIALFFVTLEGKVKGWLQIVCLFAFVGAFAMSIGTLFWFIINEIFDPDVKDIGSPVLVALQWLFNMLLSFTFVSAVTYIGQSTMFWIFGGVGVMCVVLLAIFLPPEKIEKEGIVPFKDITNEFSQELTPSIFSKERFYNPKEEAIADNEILAEIPEESLDENGNLTIPVNLAR